MIVVASAVRIASTPVRRVGSAAGITAWLRATEWHQNDQRLRPSGNCSTRSGCNAAHSRALACSVLLNPNRIHIGSRTGSVGLYGSSSGGCDSRDPSRSLIAKRPPDLVSRACMARQFSSARTFACHDRSAASVGRRPGCCSTPPASSAAALGHRPSRISAGVFRP